MSDDFDSVFSYLSTEEKEAVKESLMAGLAKIALEKQEEHTHRIFKERVSVAEEQAILQLLGAMRDTERDVLAGEAKTSETNPVFSAGESRVMPRNVIAKTRS